MDSSRSSTVAGDGPAAALPVVPKDEAFNDDSKVPFLTPWTIMMTILVSVGGVLFGYDTGQISGFLQVGRRRYSCSTSVEGGADHIRWIVFDMTSQTIEQL